ncbi:RICIN domain-containing protein [Amycolatopsis sp. NPDC005003]
MLSYAALFRRAHRAAERRSPLLLWFCVVLTLLVALTGVVTFEPPRAAAQPAPPASNTGPAEAADLPSARATARLQNRRIEALSERTETETTWVNPDGSRTTEVNGGPIRVRRGEAWVPVDLTLTQGADGAVRSKAHPRGLVLAGAGGKQGETRDLASVQAAGGQVALQYTGPLPAPVLAGDTATYPEIQPGVDLQVKATRTGFEQFFVVKRRPSAALDFTLPVRASGLTTKSDADGNTQLVGPHGEVVGALPAAEMWDAKVDPRSGDPAGKVRVGKTTAPKAKAAGVDVTVTPDSSYFGDPARAYPVTVDPGVTIWTSFDTFTQSSIANTDQSGQPELRLGTFDGGTTKARSYLHFDVSRFRGTRVQSAKLWLYATHSYSCSARNWEIWDTALVGTGTRWSNQPNPYTRWATTGATLGHDSACADNWIGTDIPNLIGAWAANGVTTGSMVLKAESETDTYGWKKFSSSEGGAVPHLDVTYNTRPNPAAGLSVSDRGDNGGATYTRSLTPTLTFRPSDPDGDDLTAVFYVYDGETMIADYWQWGVPSGSVAQWKIPAGLLQEGRQYRFRATSFDGSKDFGDDAWVGLQSVRSGQYVDVAACGWGNGTRVQQYPANGADCQKFFPWGTGDGYYQFRVRHSGQVLDNRNCVTDNGNPVITYDQVYGDCQKWAFERQGNGVYKFAVKNANKVLDQSCSTTNGTALVIWERVANDCQTWRMVPTPANGVAVPWLTFTVDTQAPGAPTVSSADYPSDDAWHKAAGQAGTFAFAPAPGSTDVAAYVYGLDVTPATEVAAGADGKAAPSITPATDGQHVLSVRTKDRAGNLSAIVSHRFNVGRGGFVRPAESARVVSRVPLQVTAEPALTHVKFAWRRGPGAAVESDIPPAHLKKADGSALGTGFVPLSSLGGTATWTAADTLGATAGVVQVKAVLATDAAGTGAYAMVWRTVIVDPSADGAENEELGGGSLNLLTGDFSQSTTDAQEFGLSVSRTASSRDPRAGYQPQRERLTANQQKITTDTAGFQSLTAAPTRVTDRGHESGESLQLTPVPSGQWGSDTYAAIEGDMDSGFHLGTKPGRLYRITGWIYVPASTGLNPGDGRGLRIVGYTKNADNDYHAQLSNQPAVTDAWVQLSLDFKVPADASQAFVRLYNGFAIGSGKPVYFDDLSVRELTAPFGPQWLGGTSADATEIDYTRLTLDADNVAQVEQVDGSKVWFTKAGNGAFFPEPGAEDLSLSFDGTNYKLAETDGTVTLFSRAADGGSYLVSSTTPPAQAATTRYVYENVDDQVRIKRAVAPVEAGIGDCTTATPARGCEAIEYDYATATTATATAFGDFAGQVRGVMAWTTDPANGAVGKVGIAQYAYDDLGRLREVWDPRLSPPLKTTYAYDDAGRVTQVGATGELPWMYDFGAAGTGDPNAGRLLRVRRATLKQGSATEIDGEVASTVVYNVPLTRAAGGPYDLDGPSAAAWSQTDIATDATAIFGPEDPVAVNTATPSAPGPDGYRAANVHYLDAAAKEVNTATPGGYIDTTEFDRFGNPVRTLEASNRALALGQLPGGDDQLAALGLAQYDSKTRAVWLDTQTRYSADGLDEVESRSPLTRMALDADPDQVVNARAHATKAYDEGKPDGTAYHLVTTERTGAEVVGMTGEQDVKVSKNGYDPAIGGVSGWGVREATKITLDAEGPSGAVGTVTTAVRYDDRGRGRESRKIDATGTDAGTTLSVFYTAGANPDDAACGNRPEWAGSPCVTRPGGAITGHDAARMTAELPVKRIESYTRFGEADRISETVAGRTRTTVTTYDGADRIAAVELSGDVGTPVQKVSTTYDPATGDATSTQFADGTKVQRAFDRLGRLRSYTDADGAWTNSEFDRFGKPVKVTDSLGSTQTFTYDRAAEPRGLLTSVTDSVGGTITAKYGPDGQLVEQTLPGGIRLNVTLDPAGDPVARSYTRISDNVLVAASSSVDNVRGQVVRQNGPGSSKTFGYDRWGRLTSTAQVSSATGICTTRAYTYDRRSNRTGKTTKTGSAAGECPGEADPAAATESHAFDSADRITDAGYTYDAFGRITQTPTGVQNSYYTNDLLAGQQTADARMSWTLDPALRFRKFTSEKLVDGSWASAVTKVNHYGADNDEPRWIAEDVTQANNVSRNVEGPDGDLALVTGQTGGVTLQLLSLHGDVMAQVPVDPAAGTVTGAVTVLDSDEFGLPSADTPAAKTARYGWLGGKERSSEALGGVVLMGVRGYDPGSGRFLQPDPEPGGGATAYDYCNADPVNCTDLDGRWGFGSFFKAVANVVAKVAEVASYIPGPIGTIAAGVSAVAYAATGNWAKAGEMAITAAANLVGAGAVVKVAARVVKAAAKVGGKAASGVARAGRGLAGRVTSAVRRGCNSFAPDTRVLLADGSTRPISEIEEGDLVAATDPETGETYAEPVVNVIVGLGDKHLVQLSTGDGEPVTATANHPIWVDGRGWTEAGAIGIGDRVLLPGGATASIRVVRDLGHRTGTLVYNLTVDGTHTFTVVSGGTAFVTHNASGACPVGGGRSGKAPRLRQLANDDKVAKHLRGYIKNSIRQRGKPAVPPGYQVAHYRTHEAARGCSYRCGHLQTRELHRLQHKYDNNGRRLRGKTKIRR